MESLFSLFFMAQIVGFVGYFLYSASSYAKTNNAIASYEAVGCMVIAAHALMLGSVIGCLVNVLYFYFAFVVRISGYNTHGKSYRMGLFLGFLALVVMSVYTWQGLFTDVLAFAATTVFILGRSRRSLEQFRVLSIVSIGIWMAFNIVVGSVAGLIFNVIYIHGHLNNLGAYTVLRNRFARPVKV